MNKERKNKGHSYAVLSMTVIVVLLLAVAAWLLLSPMTVADTKKYVYIDNDDNIDSVYQKLDTISRSSSMHVFKMLGTVMHYGNNIHSGRYLLSPDESTLTTFRKIRNGVQDPVRLTVPSVRTVDRMAAELSKRLLVDSATIATALHSNDVCQSLGYDTATIMAMFIPNTYDVYWNISVDKLLERMNHEYKIFWSDSRKAKAANIELSEIEVSTLASIIDEETANDQEKPMIAGMYINRLKFHNEEYPNGMPLQADPTIKFAMKDFGLHRIYHNMLTINSPYNTYMNPGLPPGPIRNPSVAGIDAVLNWTVHDYLYMCAKEDFSGTHNFAKTYEEHLRNAARYSKALDNRGIKK